MNLDLKRFRKARESSQLSKLYVFSFLSSILVCYLLEVLGGEYVIFTQTCLLLLEINELVSSFVITSKIADCRQLSSFFISLHDSNIASSFGLIDSIEWNNDNCTIRSIHNFVQHFVSGELLFKLV